MIGQYNICENIDDCLARLVDDDHLAVIASKRHAMANHRIPNWLIYCFDNQDRILGYPVSMFMPNDDYQLHESVNKFVQFAVETGLFVKWTKDSQSPFKQSKQPANTKFLTHQLTIEQFFTGLAFYAVFTTFSIGAFVAEQIVKRFVRQPNAGRFWRIAEMLIDGDRHFMIPVKRMPLRRRNIHVLPRRLKLIRIK